LFIPTSAGQDLFLGARSGWLLADIERAAAGSFRREAAGPCFPTAALAIGLPAHRGRRPCDPAILFRACASACRSVRLRSSRPTADFLKEAPSPARLDVAITMFGDKARLSGLAKRLRC